MLVDISTLTITHTDIYLTYMGMGEPLPITSFKAKEGKNDFSEFLTKLPALRISITLFVTILCMLFVLLLVDHGSLPVYQTLGPFLR